MRPLHLLRLWTRLAIPLAARAACRVASPEVAWTPAAARPVILETPDCGPSVELDSAMRAAGPVYRACEVDREAAALPLVPHTFPMGFRGQCRSGNAHLAFVVDTSGRALPRTARTLSATHPDCARAAVSVLPRYHFRPAVLGDRTVPALVDLVFRFDTHGE
jgi:hypothetical protein